MAEVIVDAKDGVDDGDTLLDSGALGVVESDGDLIGGGVEILLGDVLGQANLDQSLLEAHRHSGAVFDGPGEVVDVDVGTEDLPSVAVLEGDGRSGERDEGCVRQRVLEVPGIPVEVVVVAAMCFIAGTLRQHAGKIEQQSDDIRSALARLLGQTQAALSVAADAAHDAA